MVLAAPASPASTSPSVRAAGPACSAQRPVLGQQLGGAAALGLALVPLDLEGLASLARRPEALADDRDSRRHLHHVGHARHLERRPPRRTTSPWRRRGEAARSPRSACRAGRRPSVKRAEPSVLAFESTRGATLPISVQSFGSLSGTSAGTGSCGRGRPARRTWPACPGRVRHDALGGGELSTGTPHFVRGRGAPASRAPCAPALRSCCHELAMLAAAAGALHGAPEEVVVAGGVGGRGLDPDLRPVGVQLFGDDGGEPGVAALAHLQVLADARSRCCRGRCGRRRWGRSPRCGRCRGAGQAKRNSKPIVRPAPAAALAFRNVRRSTAAGLRS